MPESSPSRDPEELQRLAESAKDRSGAAGVAIALAGSDGVACRARAGEMAPAIGASAESGISGEALRSGRLLRCDDTENDDRVNLEVCRWLGIRSMVLVPVRDRGRTVGLVSAFSPQPNGFATDAVALLQEVAARLSDEPRPATADARRHVEMSAPPAIREPELRWPLRIAIALAAAVMIAAISFGLSARRHEGLRANPAQATTAASAAPTNAASPSPTASLLDGLSVAAAAGDAVAQKELGDAYVAGDGVERNLTLASAWYILAAQHGSADAAKSASAIGSHLSAAEVAKTRYEVGRMYAAGRGTQPDRVAAYTWFLLASELGSAEANQALAALRRLMSPEQVNEAERRASDWLAKHKRPPR